MPEYTVSVINTFETDLPEQAVVQMVEWVQDNAGQTGYKVEDEAGTVTFYDAEDCA